MNKKVIIGICIGIIVIALGIFIWSKCKTNPIIFEQGVSENYAYIVYNGKEYVPYSAISSTDRGKYLGYIKDNEVEKVYKFKDYSQDEWLISYSMGESMLYKEKNTTNIPEGLTSEYEWNKNISNQNTTEPYIPNNTVDEPNNNSDIKAVDLEFNRSPENVTIEILDNTITAISLSITITDNNEIQYGWGVEFRVQEKVNGEWKNLNYISDDLSWIDIAYELNEDNQLTQKLDIEKYYGKLSNGIYRIVKPVYDNGYIDIYSNEFEIK